MCLLGVRVSVCLWQLSLRRRGHPRCRSDGPFGYRSRGRGGTGRRLRSRTATCDQNGGDRGSAVQESYPGYVVCRLCRWCAGLVIPVSPAFEEAGDNQVSRSFYATEGGERTGVLADVSSRVRSQIYNAGRGYGGIKHGCRLDGPEHAGLTEFYRCMSGRVVPSVWIHKEVLP